MASKEIVVEVSTKEARAELERLRARNARLESVAEAARKYLPSQEASIKHARAPQSLINLKKALAALDADPVKP